MKSYDSCALHFLHQSGLPRYEVLSLRISPLKDWQMDGQPNSSIPPPSQLYCAAGYNY